MSGKFMLLVPLLLPCALVSSVPVVEHFSPTNCSVVGGCLISVVGSGFLPTDPGHSPQCRIVFSEYGYYFQVPVVAPATVLNATHMRCYAPAAPAGGKVVFEVSLDGVIWSAGGSPWSGSILFYLDFLSARLSRLPYHLETSASLLVKCGPGWPANQPVTVVACMASNHSFTPDHCLDATSTLLVSTNLERSPGVHSVPVSLDGVPRGLRCLVRVELYGIGKWSRDSPYVVHALLARTPKVQQWQPVVQIDPLAGAVRVAESPMLVSGFLMGSNRGVGVATQDLCTIGSWGMNTVMMYGAYQMSPGELELVLDRALACGVLVALEMVGPAIQASHLTDNSTELWEGIASFLARVRGHPGVFGYYIGDDTIGDNITGMAVTRQWMWSHDPFHPTIGSIHVTDLDRWVVDLPFFENYPSDKGVGSNFTRSLLTAAVTQAFPMDLDVLGSTGQAFAGVPQQVMSVINSLCVIGGTPHQLWFIYPQGPMVTAAAAQAAYQTREIMPVLLGAHFQPALSLSKGSCGHEGVFCGLWSDQQGCRVLLASVALPTPTMLEVVLDLDTITGTVVAPFEFNRTVQVSSQGVIVEPMNGHSTRFFMWGQCGAWLPNSSQDYNVPNLVSDPTFSWLSFPGVGWDTVRFTLANTSSIGVSVTADTSRPGKPRIGKYALRVVLGVRWDLAYLTVPGAVLHNDTRYSVSADVRSYTPITVRLCCVDESLGFLLVVSINATSTFQPMVATDFMVNAPCQLVFRQDQPGVWWLDSTMVVSSNGTGS